MRGPRVDPQPGGPHGSGGQAAFLGGPVPGDPPQKVGGAPGQPPELPRWGPWKPAGSSAPQGGPRNRRGAGPGETREHSAPSGGPERGKEGPRAAGAPLLHPQHLEALGPGGRSAGAGLAPQAAQEVADVEKMLVDALIWVLRVQVHLEALTRQDDGRGVLIGLQDLLWGRRGAVTSARRRCLRPARRHRTPGSSARGNMCPTPSPVPPAQHSPTLGAPTAMPTAPHTVTYGHGPPVCWPPHQERGSPPPDRAPSQALDVIPYKGGPCRIQARVMRGRRGRNPFCL